MGPAVWNSVRYLIQFAAVVYSGAEVPLESASPPPSSTEPIESEWLAYAQLTSSPRLVWAGQPTRANSGHWKCWTPILRDYFLGFWFSKRDNRVFKLLASDLNFLKA